MSSHGFDVSGGNTVIGIVYRRFTRSVVKFNVCTNSHLYEKYIHGRNKRQTKKKNYF